MIALKSSAICLAACMFIGISASACTAVNTKKVSKGSTVNSWFELYYENLAENPAADFDIDMYFSQGLGTGVGLWPSLSRETVDWLKDNQHGILLNYIASTDILQLKQAESPRWNPSMEAIEAEKANMKELTGALGNKAWWDILPEWDSTDYTIGRMEFPFCWKNTNKPVLTRRESFEAFKNYYMGLRPLSDYLKQTREQRQFNICSVSGSTWTPHFAYEMGVDLAMVERDLDTVGDIQTGVAFTRGAGSQYSKPWGIDISEWRFAGNSATSYDSQNQRIGGWSESYHKRHLYISYMSGANIIHLEPVILFNGAEPNPFGKVVKDFADFSLKRHIDRGAPVVSTALLLDHDSGWNPRHWTNQRGGKQGDRVWFGTIPYSDGDWMLDNLFAMIFPGYWLHGTTPEAPWKSPEEYGSMVANGMDTRPYEPIGNSRWGDSFDVLLSNSTLEALQKYDVVILAGGITVSREMKEILKKYVEGGGTAVCNINQIDKADGTFFGVNFHEGKKTSADSTWKEDDKKYQEPDYEYTPVTLTTAVPIASNSKGDTIIAQNTVGKGKVILTTPDYLQDKMHQQILNIGQRLMDEIQSQYSVASIDGPELEYLVNQDDHRIIVTLVNNSGKEWNGNIIMDKPKGKYTTTEWLEDKEVDSVEEDRKIKIKATVPMYDLRIYVLECNR